jgi:hypothetical protein
MNEITQAIAERLVPSPASKLEMVHLESDATPQPCTTKSSNAAHHGIGYIRRSDFLLSRIPTGFCGQGGGSRVDLAGHSAGISSHPAAGFSF